MQSFIYLFFAYVLRYLSLRCIPPPKHSGNKWNLIHNAHSIEKSDLNNSTVVFLQQQCPGLV